MNAKLARFARESFLYGVGEIASKIAAILIVPILSRIFVPAEYGVIDILNVTYVFALALIDLGVTTGLQKFYYERHGEDRRVLVTSAVVGTFLIASLFAAIGIVCAKPIAVFGFGDSALRLPIILAALRLPADAIRQSVMVLFRLDRQPIRFSLFSILSVVLLPTFTLVAVGPLGLGISGVFAGALLSTGVVAVAVSVDQRSRFVAAMDLGVFRRLIGFSAPGVPGDLVREALSMLPRYVLSVYSGLSAVGVFAITDKVARIVNMVRIAFNRAWNPFAFSNAGAPDEKELYEKTFKVFGFLMLYIAFGIGVMSRPILWLLAPPEYFVPAYLVAGVCLYYGLNSMVLILSTALYTANRVAQTSYIEFVRLPVFLITAIILVPRYGVPGLVLSLNISVIIYLSVSIAVTKRHFDFSVSSRRLLSVGFLGIVMFELFYAAMSAMSSLFLIVGLAIGFILAFGAIGLLIVLSRDERIAATTALRNKLSDSRPSNV